MPSHNIYYSVQFLNLSHYRPIPDNNLKLVLVLKGKITVTEPGKTTQLSEGDLHIVNKDLNWQLDGNSDNIVNIVNISSIWLLQHFDDFNKWNFIIKSQKSIDEVKRLKSLMIQISILCINKASDSWEVNVYGRLMNVLHLLIEHFKFEKVQEYSCEYSERVRKTIDWIVERSHEDIKLYTIAQKLYTSNEHLSRQFAKEVGLNFRDYLSKVRFDRAVKEIISTERTIGDIIQSNGISRPNQFNKMFKEKYKISPKDYRARNKLTGFDSGTVSPLVKEELGVVDSVELFTFLSKHNEDSEITVSTEEHSRKAHETEIRLEAPLTESNKDYVIRIGSYKELLKIHIQKQLLLAKSVSAFNYVELEDLISVTSRQDDNYKNEELLTWSTWDNVDASIRFIKDLDIYPMVVLPLYASRSYNSNLATSLTQAITHYKMLFGIEYVEKWKFKLTIKEGGSTESILTAKKEILNVIKSQLPKSEVGIVITEKSKLINLASAPLLTEEIDFVSISICPNTYASQHYHSKNLHKANDVNFYIAEVQNEINKLGIHCPVYLHSWSTLTGDTYATNGLFFRGALLIDALISLPKNVSMLGFWLNAEVQHEKSSQNNIDNNSLSLFFSSETCRPIFHVLKLKDRMKNNTYFQGDQWVASRNGDDYQILLFNSVKINPALSVKDHLLSEYKKKINLSMELHRKGIWRIKQWTFDQKNGALYHQYGLHPTLFERDKETMDYIRTRSQPTLSVYDEQLEFDFSKSIELDINSVVLLELKLLL